MYKRHTEGELEALSEQEYNKLADQITEIAKGLGIEDAECMDIPELEDHIILRQTPAKKMGHKIWENKSEWKKYSAIQSKASKLKDEILSTLEWIADGYIKMKPVKVKYEDGISPEDSISLTVTGIFVETDYEEDETTLYCALKNPPADYDFDWDRIEASRLSAEALMTIISSLVKNAVIYSREENNELIRRQSLKH